MATKYQLVLQFQGDTLTDYDAMIKLENPLIKKLGHSAKVDGHDCGSGETNIFIFTFDPALTFCKVKHVLEREGKLQSVRAAYRDIECEHYNWLWPEASLEEFRIQ
jgi:hypothetical protein